MTAERFYTLVEECLGGGVHEGLLAVDEAAHTTHVVLAMLGRRLTHAERLHLAASLPRRLAVHLMAATGAADEDPIGRVASELEIDAPAAARRIQCVRGLLAEAARSPDALTP